LLFSPLPTIALPSHLDHSPFLGTLPPPSSVAVDHALTLNCLVFGDDPSHLFTIKIPTNDNVSALKEEIWKKKENAFKGVDADPLWKVCILANSSLQQNIQNLELIDENSLQLPVAKLSDVFPDLNEGHLHVVIRPLLPALETLKIGDPNEWGLDVLEESQ
jgi:hypothetical protein